MRLYDLTQKNQRASMHFWERTFKGVTIEKQEQWQSRNSLVVSNIYQMANMTIGKDQS